MSKILKYHSYNESLGYEVSQELIDIILKWDLGVILGSYLGMIFSKLVLGIHNKKTWNKLNTSNLPDLTFRRWKFEENSNSLKLTYSHTSAIFSIDITFDKENKSISYSSTIEEEKTVVLNNYKVGNKKFNTIVSKIKNIKSISDEMEDFCLDIQDMGFKVEIKYSIGGLISLTIKEDFDKYFLYEEIEPQINDLSKRCSEHFDIDLKDISKEYPSDGADRLLYKNCLASVVIYFQVNL